MNKPVLIAAAIAAAIIYKTRTAQPFGFYMPDQPDEWQDDQTGSFIDQIPNIDDLQNIVSDIMQPTTEQTAAANVAAMLMVIRKSEGTATDEGWRALFGWRPGNGKIFTSYDWHPLQFFNYTNNAGVTIRTSAAGAFQITSTTFNGLVKGYGYSDFTPATQEQMALSLIRERGALGDVKAGRFETAIQKMRPIWASLPGAGVNQPERSMDYIKTAYIQAGGTFA